MDSKFSIIKMDLEAINKKSVIGPVISVFVMILVVSILAGLTFLFVSQLKTQVVSATVTSGTTSNETGWLNNSGYTLTQAALLTEFGGPAIVTIINASDYLVISSANYTLVGNTIYNITTETFTSVNITYSYGYIAETTAYNAVNDTEAAGATIVNYLSLIFLAIIFGAILTLVLRIILPYINLGKQMDGF